MQVSVSSEKSRRRQRHGDAAQVIDRPGASRCPRAFEERVTSRTSQVESRRQRAHGLDVGPSSLPALQRTHGMDRQARNRRELLLREACGLAERFELRAE